ncbi:MAG: MBL fold metallo-hydrolase [Acidobacteriota bacterium]
MIRVLAIAMLAFGALIIVARNLPRPEPAVGRTAAAERPTTEAEREEPSVAEGIQAMILGAAQDGGVPHLGCTQELCETALQDLRKVVRVSSLGLIVPGGGGLDRLFLVDATPDIRSQVASALGGIGRRRRPAGLPVDGILLTHAHIGHYTGLMYLGKESMDARRIPVYASARMAAFLEANSPWKRLVSEENIALRIIRPGQPIQLLSDLTVEPLQVAHREEESDVLGFLIEGPRKRLLYIPDIDAWGRWDRDIGTLVASVDVAILDGTFFSTGELPGRSLEEIPHPFIIQTMDRLQALVEAGHRVIFTHLNHTNPALEPGTAQRKQIESRGFEVAVEGMRVEL